MPLFGYECLPSFVGLNSLIPQDPVDEIPDTPETRGGVSQGSGPHLERNGRVIVEAEHYTSKRCNWVALWGVEIDMDERNWLEQSPNEFSQAQPDPDGFHAGPSGDAYMECLPDLRVTEHDPLGPGTIYGDCVGGASLSYEIDFQTTGTYYVWVRVYSTGKEDNGMHVGIDGELPQTGVKIQWCGPDVWRWSSAQRDSGGDPCGVDGTITIEVAEPGLHTVTFHQREDGCEFDRFMLTTNPDYVPLGAGPMESPRMYP